MSVVLADALYRIASFRIYIQQFANPEIKTTTITSTAPTMSPDMSRRSSEARCGVTMLRCTSCKLQHVSPKKNQTSDPNTDNSSQEHKSEAPDEDGTSSPDALPSPHPPTQHLSPPPALNDDAIKRLVRNQERLIHLLDAQVKMNQTYTSRIHVQEEQFQALLASHAAAKATDSQASRLSFMLESACLCADLLSKAECSKKVFRRLVQLVRPIIRDTRRYVGDNLIVSWRLRGMLDNLPGLRQVRKRGTSVNATFTSCAASPMPLPGFRGTEKSHQ
ncbi:hypothetical protein BT63DRAFT_132580 [Microthyrium microscopicum]|uniref:Uncharacterized protein n=1 Tax=Microthyrium microscopicum TaxID=703497 RepID=A0A6A6UK89_9PEZI|nr:hypothetical protein BT63DRAFT_132580 [Microthyrium microscopicum]